MRVDFSERMKKKMRVIVSRKREVIIHPTIILTTRL
jgi:hypothetical protein